MSFTAAGLPASLTRLASPHSFMLAGLALFIAAALYANRLSHELVEQTDARRITRETLLRAERVLSAMKDVETGPRGYLITGDPRYLEPYTQARQALATLQADLRQGLLENDALHAQLPRLARIEQHIVQRIRIATDIIEVRKNQGIDAPRSALLTNAGKIEMDALRAEFAGLERELRREIGARSLRVDRLRRNSDMATWFSIALAVLLMLGGSYSLFRERQRRQQAEAALQRANLDLEHTVSARTRELELAHQALRRFARALEQNTEQERRALAREVHDQLGQIFTVLKLQLLELPEAQARPLAELLDHGIQVSRRIASALRPPMLDDLGLAAALQHFIAETCPELVCRSDIMDDQLLSHDQASQLFRITQEAVTNVLRHAQARSLVLRGQAEGGAYRFSIEDDGRGLVPARNGALGVLGMRERAHLIGGEFNMGPGAHGGVRIEVTLPLAAARAEQDDA